MVRSGWIGVVLLAGSAFLQLACSRPARTDGMPAARTFFAAGQSASKAAKHAEAAAAYGQAIATDPDFADAHQKYIDSTRRSQPDGGQATAELRQQYERSAREQPRRAVYQWALGLLSSDAATSDRYYTAALRLDPGFVPARIALAKNADLRGDWAAQREHLKAVVESDANNPEYLMKYAEAVERTEPPRSRELIGSVVQKFPGTPEAAHALYDLARDSSGPERRRYFDELRAGYPSDRFSWGSSAMHTLYSELTSTAEALALAREQAKLLPGNKTWTTRVAVLEAMARAETLIAERKPGEALQAIAATTRPSGRHGTTWVLLKAAATAAGGHVDEAYATVVASLAQAPDDRLQDALDRYGTALKKTPQEMNADLWRVRDAKATTVTAFELPGSGGGKPVRLADYRGRVVLLAFWFPG